MNKTEQVGSLILYFGIIILSLGITLWSKPFGIIVFGIGTAFIGVVVSEARGTWEKW